ncbi:MAG: transcription termination/antitermination NusG family protein [Candidatus Cloacimonetes bacterium]|nr:transcription termination/antitermination NusG family protein [Candidatus Cloacimonadota bacterium]
MATHKPKIIHIINGDLELPEGNFQWFVIKTKSRCEKALAEYALRNGLNYYLPQIETTHKYQYRKVVFTKPMFPGYLFSKIDQKGRDTLQISGYCARFIQVRYPKELLKELKFIYKGTEKKVEMTNVLWLSKGLEVEIISGPLAGVKGVVEDHTKLSEVRLQVEILRQAVMVKVNPTDVKIIGDYVVVDTEKN